MVEKKAFRSGIFDDLAEQAYERMTLFYLATGLGRDTIDGMFCFGLISCFDYSFQHIAGYHQVLVSRLKHFLQVSMNNKALLSKVCHDHASVPTPRVEFWPPNMCGTGIVSQAHV